MMQINYINRAIPPVWLNRPHYTIGKSPTCDIQLDDDTLATVHAHLHVDNSNNSIMLEAEHNATLSVNKQAIHRQTQLHPGDIIVFGSFTLQIANSRRQASQANDGWTLYSDLQGLEQNQLTILDQATIGRSSKCDFPIHFGSQLSRMHARLSVVNGALLVEDLGSSNGTFVNGKKISKATVKHGDKIRFAHLTYRIVAPSFESKQPDFLGIQAAKPLIAQRNTAGPTAIERQLLASKNKHTHTSNTALAANSKKRTRQPRASLTRLTILLIAVIVLALYSSFLAGFFTVP